VTSPFPQATDTARSANGEGATPPAGTRVPTTPCASLRPPASSCFRRSSPRRPPPSGRRRDAGDDSAVWAGPRSSSVIRGGKRACQSVCETPRLGETERGDRTDTEGDHRACVFPQGNTVSTHLYLYSYFFISFFLQFSSQTRGQKGGSFYFYFFETIFHFIFVSGPACM